MSKIKIKLIYKYEQIIILFIIKDLKNNRLLTHLKYFAKRIIENNQHSLEVNSFIDLIKQSYSKEYGCRFKIKKYNYIVNDDELVYLTMNVHRIIESNKLNN